MKPIHIYAIAAALVLSVVRFAHADLIVQKDGSVMEGKILSRDAKGLSVQVDGRASQPPVPVAADKVARVIQIDDHGSEVAEGNGMSPPAKPRDRHWDVPAEPAAPPIAPVPVGPTYYVIPLRGVVGETYVADILDKSLADAAKRKPTVVVLDINSPGGVASEAELMVQTLQRYSKDLRMVALVDQDLAASAITTLAIRTIYMKSTGYLGATAPYEDSSPDASRDTLDKAQAAWRTVARHSAEEGGHEPLLAEAMIDNRLALHVETVGGKKVVKEGPGPNMLTRPGKILMLTSHEAVTFGLAVDIADDFEELGQALNLKGWKEVSGLNKLLVEYLPKRREAFMQKAKEIEAEFRANQAAEEEANPSNGSVLQHVSIGSADPGNPDAGQRITVGRVSNLTPKIRANWNQHSLAAVVAFQKMEQNLQDEMALANTFGQKRVAEELKATLSELAEARTRLYADRNKYADDPTAVTAGTARPLALNYAPLPAKLSDSVKLAVDKKNYKCWLPASGITPEDPAEDLAPDGGILIGFRCGKDNFANNDIITSVQPVYLTTKGVVLGQVHGNPDANPVIDLVARNGYAVGSVKMQSWLRCITGLQLRFVRIGDARLAQADAYESEVFGKLDNPVVIGNAMPAVGMRSQTKGPIILEVSLLTVNPPEPKPISAAPAGGGPTVCLPAAFADAVKDAVTKKTYQKGTVIGSIFAKTEFEDIAPDGGILIGFQFAKGKTRKNIVSLQPIYLTSKGEVTGQIHGDAAVAPIEMIKAPPGYAVGAVTMGRDLYYDGLTVTYMKIGDCEFLMDDAYASDKIGSETNPGQPNRPATLGGDGMPVIGICGKADQGNLALGLISLTSTETAKGNH